MIRQAFTDCDLIITTGGLGPTQDDLTKEIAAEVLHDELILHEDLLKNMEDYFKRINRVMTENNKKQAICQNGRSFSTTTPAQLQALHSKKTAKPLSVCRDRLEK
jgi:molybdopterin-biosynthesis enzyme MoeA-like protein